MEGLALIVDGNQLECRYIAAVLAVDGLHVVQVARAIEGLIGAMDMDPSLIVMAEETDSLELEDVISVIRRVTQAPLLIIGSGDAAEEVNALRRGSNFYLKRPFSAAELIGRARMLVREREAPEEERDGRGQKRIVPGGNHRASCAEGLVRQT